MNSRGISIGSKLARGGVAAALAGALMLVSAAALAQQAQPAPEDSGFLAGVSRWFSRQANNISSTFHGASKQVENFGDNAGDTARSTVNGAKGAADAVVRIPATRIVSGHEKCALAPNGAPDCNSAADTMCKANGLASGKSLDMTTAEVCPAEVYLAGRRTGPGCTTDTFVSRALCQ